MRGLSCAGFSGSLLGSVDEGDVPAADLYRLLTSSLLIPLQVVSIPLVLTLASLPASSCTKQS